MTLFCYKQDEENAPLSIELLSHSHQNITDIEEKNEKLKRSESLEKDVSHRGSQRVSESTGFITVKVRSFIFFLTLLFIDDI